MRFTLKSGLMSAATLFLAVAMTGVTMAGARAADIPVAPAFTAAELAATPVDNCPTNGGSLYNQRYSPLTEIDKDSIKALKGEWRTHLGSGLGPQHSGQGEPVVYEGVLYMVTGQNDVFALDVDTGDILWKWTADIDPSRVMVCCGWVVRGVAIGEGKVFVGTLDAHMVALDQKTGKVVWDIQAEDSSKGYSITSAPRYYDGKVITGFAGGEYGIRGHVDAYDARTGKLVWRFYTIPGPGEFGHDTWPDYNDAWKYGGAPVWQTPAIDPELGLIYFSTGNPSPDQNGAIRPGDNLFNTSIVALDVETGEYRWHFQQTRHDLWDYDSPSPVVLFDVMKDGKLRHGLSQISKSGYLFLLDRVTGEPLVGMEYRKVPQNEEQATADTQPIPIGDDIINHCIDVPPEGWTLVNQGCTYTPFGREPVLYTPLAGSNWMPTSYDPNTGFVYVCAAESIGGAAMTDFHEDDLGKQTGNMIMGGEWALPDAARRSIQAAVDVRTNRLVWRFQTGAGCSAGSTVTKSGLLFIGRADGRLMAYDSATGLPVWSFQTDAGIIPSPVIFEHEGHEKIAVFSAGTLFAAGPKGDSVWLFSLDGDMDPVEPKAEAMRDRPAALNPAQAELPDREPDLDRGKAVYMETCNACHGADGQGGHAEGGAIPVDSDILHIFATAMNGGEKMPAFKELYSPEDLQDVATYVHEVILKRN